MKRAFTAVNSIIMGPNEIAVCEGSNFCVDLMFTDDGPTSDIALNMDPGGLLQGASVQLTYGTDTLFATLCWTSSSSDFMVFFQATDGDCPIANTSSAYLFAQECIPLPVELVSFHAEPLDDRVRLAWTTGSQWNFSHFIVERAAGPDGFQPIGAVSASGSTHIGSNYLFDDPVPLHGANYYRLQEVDLDGSVNLSEVVYARFDNVPTLDVRPDGNGGLWVHGVMEYGQWSLRDPLGRLHGGGIANDQGAFHVRPIKQGNGIWLLMAHTRQGIEMVKLPVVLFDAHH